MERNIVAETTTPNSAEATTTGNGQTEETKGSNSKTFTQEEVDAIVAARLKCEAGGSYLIIALDLSGNYNLAQ